MRGEKYLLSHLRGNFNNENVDIHSTMVQECLSVRTLQLLLGMKDEDLLLKTSTSPEYEDIGYPQCEMTDCSYKIKAACRILAGTREGIVLSVVCDADVRAVLHFIANKVPAQEKMYGWKHATWQEVAACKRGPPQIDEASSVE